MTTAAASLAHADPAEWETTRTRGENGHAELTAAGLGDALLALFDKAVRGLDETRIRTLTADIIAEARDAGDEQRIKDLFLLAFHTRWCRGGKGERKLLYQLPGFPRSPPFPMAYGAIAIPARVPAPCAVRCARDSHRGGGACCRSSRRHCAPRGLCPA